MEIDGTIQRCDTLVVGGGPAGLSAGVTLGRARRSAIVFDSRRPGRSDWKQVNRNYLGFPDGIDVDELIDRGRAQVENYGGLLVDVGIRTLVADEHGFVATTENGHFHGRTVILATGVTDSWVEFPGYEEYIGRTMHWCLACDGYEMEGQHVVVVGNDDHAAVMGVQALQFRPASVTLVTNHTALGISGETVAYAQERGVRIVVGCIASARSREKGVFEALVLEDGQEIALDHLFSEQGISPNTELARAIDVELNDDGYIKVDTEGRTSLPGVYAAGDMTRLFSHQVSTAVHEGATAANAANFDLFERDEAALRMREVAGEEV